VRYTDTQMQIIMLSPHYRSWLIIHVNVLLLSTIIKRDRDGKLSSKRGSSSSLIHSFTFIQFQLQGIRVGEMIQFRVLALYSTNIQILANQRKMTTQQSEVGIIALSI